MHCAAIHRGDAGVSVCRRQGQRATAGVDESVGKGIPISDSAVDHDIASAGENAVARSRIGVRVELKATKHKARAAAGALVHRECAVVGYGVPLHLTHCERATAIQRDVAIRVANRDNAVAEVQAASAAKHQAAIERVSVVCAQRNGGGTGVVQRATGDRQRARADGGGRIQSQRARVQRCPAGIRIRGGEHPCADTRFRECQRATSISDCAAQLIATSVTATECECLGAGARI